MSPTSPGSPRPGTASALADATAGGPGTLAPPLVHAEWLRARLGGPDVRLVQVDADATAYYRAHVPGAVPLDVDDDLHEPHRRTPVTRAGFEALCDRLGIARDDHVVLHGAVAPEHAAYAYWTFRYHQHPRVSLLDGGLPAWLRAGGDVTDAAPVLSPRVGYRSPGPDPTLRVSRDDVLQHYVNADDGHVLIDCRSPAEYAGRSRHPLDLALQHLRMRGHIPGARNLPSTAVLRDEEGRRLRPVGELRELFRSRGVQPDSEVALYCRTVERSSLLWFVLHDLLGHRSARWYDGGWVEYSGLVGVPVGEPRPDARS